MDGQTQLQKNLPLHNFGHFQPWTLQAAIQKWNLQKKEEVNLNLNLQLNIQFCHSLQH